MEKNMTQLKYKLLSNIREIPNFPKKGILFKDITPILQNADLFTKALVAHQSLINFELKLEPNQIDKVVGMEARGFWFGPILAHQYHAGFVPVRKPGKLPSKVYSQEYGLEYRENDILEIHEDSIKSGEKVLIVDDLLATGGTAEAAAKLVEKAGGEVVGMVFFIELESLKGREKLSQWKPHSVIQFL